MRTFNLTGPCDPNLHHLIPPLERAPTALPLIRSSNYLAISGPRQSGKTSLLRALVDSINAEGWARSVLVTCEPAGVRNGIVTTREAEQILVAVWHRTLRVMWPEIAWPPPRQFESVPAGAVVGEALTDWSLASAKPLVFVIDEIDTLARDPFLSILSQIRAGHSNRGRFFPHSIVLAGMRNLRDHDIALGGAGTGSPFNIVHELVVSTFSREEITRLYAQHTEQTGQRFSDDAVALAWDQTRGQPLLVNAIAHGCVTELVPDTAQTIDAIHIDKAIRGIETRVPTHLASLAGRLSEERVLNVVAPAITGADLRAVPTDDIRYVCELGILESRENNELVAANPIYARALVRHLDSPIRANLGPITPTWRKPDGSIDLDRLKTSFLDFWTQHGRTLDPLITRHEIVPHIVLMAWLDRVANGGGRVDRELGIARGRLDLLLNYRDLRLPIEVKVHRDHGADPVPAGLEQLDRYCDGLRVDRAWLVVFDQRSTATGTRLEAEEVVTAGGRQVLVIRA